MSENNGKAATQASVQSKHQMYALRVFRIEPGMNVLARMLSESYGGCFTHFLKGRSALCHGRDCELRSCILHRTWKGYCAIEVWHDLDNCWMPWCLEITERLELDLRGLYARGQTWELYRDMQHSAKKTPVNGKLMETCDADTLPPAFDIVPCLRSIYHVNHVDLSIPSPLPMQVIVSASAGEPPAIVKEIRAKKKAQADAPPYSFVEEMNRRKKSPSEKKAETA